MDGSKHAYHDGRTHTYGPGYYLCTTMPTPLEAEVPRATPEEPVLGALIDLDTRPMTELLIQYRATKPPHPRRPAPRPHSPSPCGTSGSPSRGLQGAANNLGTALGTAIIGAMVLSGLGSSFVSQVASDDRIEPRIADEVEISFSTDVTFVASSDVRAILESGDVGPALADALVESYEEAQLDALRLGLLAVAAIILVSLLLSGWLPGKRVEEVAEEVARTQPPDHDEEPSLYAPATAVEAAATPR